MNDHRLLEFYLERFGPEAQRWNLFPQNLSAELNSRRSLLQWVKPFRAMRVCNIGIGVGEWDDFLGYWLHGRGRLISVDRDRRICEVFKYRQKRERHPNPAAVTCRDFVQKPLPSAQFDLVTLIGSTAHESQAYGACITACLSLLRSGGRLFYMDFARYHKPAEFLTAARRAGGKLESRAKSTAFSDFVVLVKKTNKHA